MSDQPFSIMPFSSEHTEWAHQKLIEDWGAEYVVAHGEVIYPVELPGFIAELNRHPVGLITYQYSENECEIITLNSWRNGIGIGSALVQRVLQEVKATGCKRLFLITTNNNLHALHFYQKRGFIISGVNINAINESRKIKKEIPLFDDDGLPIRDEIVLEVSL